MRGGDGGDELRAGGFGVAVSGAGLCKVGRSLDRSPEKHAPEARHIRPAFAAGVFFIKLMGRRPVGHSLDRGRLGRRRGRPPHKRKYVTVIPSVRPRGPCPKSSGPEKAGRRPTPPLPVNDLKPCGIYSHVGFTAMWDLQPCGGSSTWQRL